MNKPRNRETSRAKSGKGKISLLPTQIACKNCQLQSFCSQLEPDSALPRHLDQIAEHPRPLHRGEHLFHQGQPFRNLYVVRTGGIKLYLTTYDGTEQILNFYFPGELLSLDSIVSGQHKTSAVALDTTSVCRLPFERVKSLCHEYPRLYDKLFEFAGQEIANEHIMMLTMGQKSADEKFAVFLLDIAMRHKKSGHYHQNIQLCMSRHDIANYLFLADETISRLFSKFSTQNILKTNRKTIQILDFNRLEAIANLQSPELIRASN